MTYSGSIRGIPGATVREVESVPSAIPGAHPAGRYTMAKPNDLLVVVPDTGSFRVRDGTSVEIALVPNADPGTIKLYLNGSARAALIHQRGELPLHGATIVSPTSRCAVTLCGTSGAGKSTLAAELCRRGWLLLSDAGTRVTWDGANALAWPTGDHIKLSPAACEVFGVKLDSLERVSREVDKYYVPFPTCDEPVRLAGVLELAADDVPSASSVAERMLLVTRNTWKAAHIGPLGKQAEHFQMASRVVASCHVAQFSARSRPVHLMADAVAEMMEM